MDVRRDVFEAELKSLTSSPDKFEPEWCEKIMALALAYPEYRYMLKPYEKQLMNRLTQAIKLPLNRAA